MLPVTDPRTYAPRLGDAIRIGRNLHQADRVVGGLDEHRATVRMQGDHRMLDAEVRYVGREARPPDVAVDHVADEPSMIGPRHEKRSAAGV